MIYLVELDGMDAAGNLVTLRYASGAGYISEDRLVYEPRVLSAGTYERHLWQPGTTAGLGSASIGSIDIANADGALDIWLDWAFDGRAVRVLYGDPSWPRARFQTVLRGAAESISLSTSLVRINLRDRAAALAAMPLNTDTYGGSNALPAGIDGTPNDIAGQYKPWLFGEVENCQPVRVNTSALIYQISRVAIAQVVTVWDGSAAITAGTNRGTVATLQASTPTAATYDYCLGSATEGAYIRLGSSPSYNVTVYAREGAAAVNRTIAQVMQRVLAAVGVPAGDLLRLAAFDSKQSGTIGYYCGPSGAKAGDVLNALAASGGATWQVARDGTFDLLRLEEPAGAPVVALTADHLLIGSGSPIAVIPINGGVPAYALDLSWQHNWDIQTPGQFATSVAAARRDWLAKDYRHQTSTDTTVWNPATLTGRHPLAQTMTVVTELRNQTDATAESARQLPLYSQQRRYLSVYVPSAVAASVNLGDCITVTAARFGCDAGRLFLVTGIAEDFSAGTTELFLWS